MKHLYVHMPFCRRRCYYCAFVVYVAAARVVESYLQALAREAARYHGTEVETVYVGGGTPTMLSREQLLQLRRILTDHFVLSGTEVTIEGNPEDFDGGKAEDLLDAGFTRVSLGAQSFQEKYLRFLGRGHDAQRIVSAYGSLREAGCRNINIDLMFSMPGQTKDDLARDLGAVMALEPEHVSLYSLTVESPSRFFVQKVRGPKPDEQTRLYEEACRRLQDEGLGQYEISNFARPGRECRHNLNCWESGDYLGLGVAAHSHLAGQRSWNVTRLKDYLERALEGRETREGGEELPPQRRLTEAVLFGLRMNRGVSLPDLQERFQCGLTEEQSRTLESLIKEKFLAEKDGRLTTTPRGRLVLDAIAVRLI